MKKICIVVGSRANYSSIKSLMREVKAHPNLELQLIVCASAVLEKYGKVVDQIELDGFSCDFKLNFIIEGETPITMAKSTGLGVTEIANALEVLKPNFVVTVGDRYETMATTIAATYMNIPLAHTMGGEVTGTIDESIRHATTKFAHLHFTASEDATRRVIRMGEIKENVHWVGCPRIDLVKEILDIKTDIIDLEKKVNSYGIGSNIKLTENFLLLSFHPVTTEFGNNFNNISEIFKAIQKLGLQTIILWPNSDAGSSEISKFYRIFREKNINSPFHFVKNLPIDVYVKLMDLTCCLVGNSSSGIREGAFIGTPVVNIGSRQNLRESGENVITVEPESSLIFEAIKIQIKKIKYNSNNIYGDGNAGFKIAEILSKSEVEIQKTITY
jgi:UDP-hydrolysing UDP-N-acetyl-D-glucosamine 2-epimerase